MFKNNSTRALLEERRTTPEQHTADYLALAPLIYSAHHILHLVNKVRPRSYVIVGRSITHDVTVEVTGVQIQVRTSTDFGSTEMTIRAREENYRASFSREMPLPVVAVMIAAAVDIVCA